MSPRTPDGRAWFSVAALLTVVALLVSAGLLFVLDRSVGVRASAIFSTAIGIYPQSEVRVLGVPVGVVDEVIPQGTTVRVDFHVRSDVQIPADALALVVAPSIIADRAIQLAPAYTGGPTLADGAVIPPERTAVPPEFDDLLTAVQELTTSLGPQGVNRDGALSEVLRVGADNLAGNGQRLNTTLDNASRAINTLSTSREDLFGTVRNLQEFTTNLKRNDAAVREFTRQFAEVNRFLVGEREDLGETVRLLSEVLGEVAVFVRDNRSRIDANAEQLADVLETVNGERLALEQILDTAPMGLSNLVDTYNAQSGTLNTRNAALATALCEVFGNGGGLGVPLPGLPPELLEVLLPGTDGQGACTQASAALPISVPSPPPPLGPPLGQQSDGDR